MCRQCLKADSERVHTPLLRGSLPGAAGGALRAAPVGPAMPSLRSRRSQGHALAPAAAPSQDNLSPPACLRFSIWFLRCGKNWHRCLRGNPLTRAAPGCCRAAGGPGQPPGWTCLRLPWERALPGHRKGMGLLRGFCASLGRGERSRGFWSGLQRVEPAGPGAACGKHLAVVFRTDLPFLPPQVFVETLDKCFENVCELDLIFHMDKVGCRLCVLLWATAVGPPLLWATSAWLPRSPVLPRACALTGRRRPGPELWSLSGEASGTFFGGETEILAGEVVSVGSSYAAHVVSSKRSELLGSVPSPGVSFRLSALSPARCCCRAARSAAARPWRGAGAVLVNATGGG